ncbi:MAG: ATP-binding protein [Pseudomonadota bacterium]
MNAPLPLATDWLDANQRLLSAEFARLQARLGGADDEGLALLPALREAMPEPAAIDRIAALFSLSAFERDVLLLAAGVEMDAQFAAAVAAAQDGRRGGPSFGLALATLDGAHWSALTPQHPLRRWSLLAVDARAGLAQAPLHIDERVLHALAGIDGLDAQLRPLLQAEAAPALIAASHLATARALTPQLRALQAAPPIVLLHGSDADGQVDVAASVASELGLGLYRLRATDIPAAAGEQELLATLWQREAALSSVALLVDAHQGVDLALLQSWLRRLGGVVFVAAAEPLGEIGTLAAAVDKPAAHEQRALWRQTLPDALARDPAAQRALDAMAAQYRFSARSIARRAHVWREDGGAAAFGACLQAECRALARPRLDGLAQRIAPHAGWDALVLPEAQMQTLRQIASQVQHRLKVYDDWGFASQGGRGLGLSALFFGDSGVGKTLACEVLANELGLDLYRIDLSAVVSKYIGETEKNLKRVFDAAEDSSAVLLFDEADALFGKRGEVKDSHDRYANIEVSYLLQRMESYRGLAVLTTNQRAALDPAFLRRLRFVLQFPFPDAAQREAIWRRVFPAAMPRAELDYAKLARLPMPGGHIRNIALNAAFLAAAEDRAVQMNHLVQAAHHEAAKRERPLADTQTRGWAP